MKNNDIVPGFDDGSDDNLKIKLQKVTDADGCLVMFLTGYIDTYNSNHFQKRIQKAIETGYIKLIFQCKSLNYVSSTGIGSFTVFLKAVKSQGGDVVLLEIQPRVYEVFQLLGFSQFFNIKDSMHDCIKYFRVNVPGEKDSVFPRVLACPVCSREIKAVRPEHFCCPECKTSLAIDNTGQVFIG